jgi:uncharacterized protein (DUF885 family)
MSGARRPSRRRRTSDRVRAAAAPRSRVRGGIPPGTRGPDRRFYITADRCLAECFRSSPVQATSAGDHRFDDRLDDFSAAGLRARVALARRHLLLLRRFDPATLSPAVRVDRELLMNDAEAAVFAIRDLQSHRRDPQCYLDVIGYGLLYLTLGETGSPPGADRLRGLRGRLQAIPALLAAARRHLRRPGRVVTEQSIRTAAGTLAFLERGLPSLWADRPRLRPGMERARARAAEAMRRFHRWLQTDLLPRSTGDWRLGESLWTRKLRLTLGSSMAPATILARAEELLASLRDRMLQLAEPLHDRLLPGHRHPERGEERIDVLVREVLDLVARRHSTRASLLDDTRSAVAEIKGFLRRADIVRLPPDDDPLVIEPTPGFLDGTAVAFFNPPPSLEPHLKKSFWISSVPRGRDPEGDRAMEESFFREYNHHALKCLTIHEAFPGHYVQYWHALGSPLATIYKKIFSSGTFAEGWAVLAERLVFEAGFAADEAATRLVHLKQMLRVPINALLDARLHTAPMSDAEADRWALELMTRRGFQEEAEARGKLRRAKVTSVQLSTYFVGYLELSDLLEEVRARDGARFNLRAFTDRLLSFGTIPPASVRALLLQPRG